MDLPQTLQGYLQSLDEGHFPALDEFPMPCDELLKKRLLSLAGSRWGGPISRTTAMKKIFARAVEVGYIKSTHLRFSLSQKERAYVCGRDLLSFSLPYVCKESGAKLVKVLLHEFAHLLLIRHPQYDELLSLNRAYLRDVNFDDETVKMLSPVELCATLISIRLLGCIASVATVKEKTKIKLQTQMEEEKAKLNYALRKYKNSSI